MNCRLWLWIPILVICLAGCVVMQSSPSQQSSTPIPPSSSLPPSTALPTTSAILQRPTNLQIGLNFIRFFWEEPSFYQPEEIFRDFQALGVQAFRQFIKADLLWDVVEPNDGQWSFQRADAVLANPGFEPIVTLFSLQYASPTPPWAKKTDSFQKTLGPEATDYLETVVRRYGSLVRYWEVGNEMDHWRAADPSSSVKPEMERMPECLPSDGFSPQEQGIFLAQVAQLIRRLDPDAVIVMPGISGLDSYCLETWFAGLVAGGGTDWFDVVNYHYYGSWERYTLLRPQLDKARERFGITQAPVWMTETGVTSDPTLSVRTNYPNSPQAQAADVFRRIVQAWGAGDSFVAWHTYLGSGDTTSNWRGYGIRTEWGEEKPAYAAFALLISELVPFERVEKINSDARGLNAYRILRLDGSSRTVVWGNGIFSAPEGSRQVISVVPETEGSTRVQEIQSGTEIPLQPEPVLIK
ncbi:MAG: hypothetical protein NTV14_02015 [Coprothermobacterota bacterium]|nr:hypothetical protein [Coprothermobacterota bacterium]